MQAAPRACEGRKEAVWMQARLRVQWRRVHRWIQARLLVRVRHGCRHARWWVADAALRCTAPGQRREVHCVARLP
eukprot:4382408-Prymnesium_polylepis.1